MSLHSLATGTNPYMTVISILCKTLEAFDDDNWIPAYGFGDVTTRDHSVFSFAPRDEPMEGFRKVLDAYRWAPLYLPACLPCKRGLEGLSATVLTGAPVFHSPLREWLLHSLPQEWSQRCCVLCAVVQTRLRCQTIAAPFQAA
jgi:hypothetical protein